MMFGPLVIYLYELNLQMTKKLLKWLANDKIPTLMLWAEDVNEIGCLYCGPKHICVHTVARACGR